MSATTVLAHSVRIARTEWRCHRRDAGQSRLHRGLLVGLRLAVAAALGAAGRSIGRDLAAGQSIPVPELWLAGVVAFTWAVWRSATLTHERFSRLNPDMLLTAVPARAPALGLLGFVSARLAASLAVPTLGVAGGLALGLRSPLVALTVIIAIAGMAALAVAVGVTGRLATQLVGTRLARGRFYRDLFVLFGWAAILSVVAVFRSTLVSALPVLAGVGSLSGTWIVDLALLGAGERAGIEARRGLAVFGLLLPSLVLFAGGTTVLTRRLWEAEPTGSDGTHGSHPLVDGGRLDRVLAGTVSQPVRTVARERWLVERRAPRGVLNMAYVLLFVGVIGFPVVGIVGVPLLLLVAFAIAMAVGVAFGSDPIGVEYRVLPMLFTTIRGQQFVSGLLLAALVVGAPTVTAVVVPIGLLSSATLLETLAVALSGVAICACTVAVGVALGMGVDHDGLAPVPSFFTDVPAYAERGWAPFRRLALLFAVVSVAGLPAFLGTMPVVSDSGAGIGAPAAAVRIGSLLLTTLVAVAIASGAVRIAVRRYQRYQLT
ncbi:hypothetical protein [Natrinema pallidum]|uniref:Uncharacterized protein n=1 Tax=Natrinema pallidum TaxID=69527 RepID=A0A4P9TFT7_9EURY|nr:hypothetical protein [Natrinema pallidum]QCW03696.1 hypothetical protein FGF80_10795 [Natrinema pallidum]